MEQLRPVCGSGCVSAQGCGPMRPPTLLAATMLHVWPWLRIEGEREREMRGLYQ